ncbi:MAG: hypothetical protein GY745_09565 [Actinomycetia bacterium]|nr:hypothetical protein [Actinomycetes bacterium]
MTPFEVDEPTDILEPSHTQTATVERSSIAARTTVVVVVLALVGAGLYGVRSFLSPAGASSGTDAVQQMLDAVADEDFIAAAELVAPAERRSIINPSFEIVGELARLEILDPDLDLSSLPGVDFEFTDVTLSTELLGPGVEMVYIDTGRATVRTTPDELPVGPVVDDLMAEFGGDLGAPTQQSEAMGSATDGIVVIAVDGRWYVSMAYSAAEAIRRQAGAPLPTFDQGPEPVGGEDPEAALRGVIEAGIELDLEAMIAMLPPDEYAALYDYSPLFLDDAQQTIDGFLAEIPGGFSWGLTELSTTSDIDGDEAIVRVRSFGFEIEAPEGRADLRWDGECFHWEVTDNGWIDAGDTCSAQAEAMGDMGFAMPPFANVLDTSELGIVARQVDGRWYVSPFESVFEAYLVILRQLEREDIDEMVDFVDDLVSMGLGGGLLPNELTPPGGQLEGITIEGDDDDVFVPVNPNENGDLIAPGFGEAWDHTERSDMDPELWQGSWWDLDMSTFVRGSDGWSFDDELQVSIAVAEFADPAAASDQFAGIFDSSPEPSGPAADIGDQVARLSAYENEPGEGPYSSGQWLLQVGRFVVTVDVYGGSYDEVATVAEAHLHEAAEHLAAM